MPLVTFSSETARWLAQEGRLPPTYVGSRRIRPSSQEVQQAWTGRKSDPSSSSSPVATKNIEYRTGEGRRLTKQEKKERRRLFLLEQKERKRQKREQQRNEQSTAASSSNDTSMGIEEQEEDAATQAALAQELADLRGERVGVPPVAILSAAIPSSGPPCGVEIVWDDAPYRTQAASQHCPWRCAPRAGFQGFYQYAGGSSPRRSFAQGLFGQGR